MRIPLLICSGLTAMCLCAQSPQQLAGLEYRGTSEATPQEGCEGCGNPGHVKFDSGHQVSYTLPGDDMMGSAQYVRKGNVISFTEGKWTMELKGDTLFFNAYDNRYVYLRVR